VPDPTEDPRPAQERFEEALREHVADEARGAYMTDYVVIAAGALLEDPNQTMYVIASSNGPFHHRVGLVQYLAERTNQQITPPT
jgi:hypothetical protein